MEHIAPSLPYIGHWIPCAPDATRLLCVGPHVLDDTACLEHVASLLLALPPSAFQGLVDRADAIDRISAEDGKGLRSGGFVDLLVKDWASVTLGAPRVPRGQADLLIAGIPISLKSGREKTTFALSWSKNPPGTPLPEVTKDILVYIRTTANWPKGERVRRGLYLVAKAFARTLPLCRNNKSDTVFSSTEVLRMVRWSEAAGLYVALPDPSPHLSFSMWSAFD